LIRRARSPRTDFGKAYYSRFYENPGTRAVEPGELKLLVDFVVHYMKYLGLEAGRVLDAGCGLGLWEDLLRAHWPHMTYAGIETSEYLCRKCGWKMASLTTFSSRMTYDLVICQSVLQYLGTDDVRLGLQNLARLCRGALYLEIVTKEDWSRNCNQAVTDSSIFMRTASWYATQIRPYFTACGGGVFLPRTTDVVMYELEKL